MQQCVSLPHVLRVSALTPVFVQTGNDLLLDANGADCSEDGVLIFWRFNEKDNLVRLTCHKDREPTVNKLKYPERTEITEKTSLKLKNCREDFTGVYSAIRISDENEVVAKYNVTVKDPVSPAHLKVDSVFNSSDVCNLTVTCSTDHSSVSSSFTCGKETCKQDNGQQTDTSQQGNVLHVYLSDESVICNHSNQVSWANSTKRIELILEIIMCHNKSIFIPVYRDLCFCFFWKFFFKLILCFIPKVQLFKRSNANRKLHVWIIISIS
uniref:Immunoglobulin V-set domain-containing protein n=1 Tax=Oryzias latipes TaxID=8090 RepID=A0A3B3H9A9_ORYLA